MEKKMMTLAALTLMGSMATTRAWADEPAVTVSVGADVVTSYVWRGQECAGFSIQPSMTATWNAASLSLGVWANAELFEASQAVNMTEFDWVLSWQPIEALSVGLTDYYFYGGRYWSDWKGNASASHNLEANVAYDFGPVAVSWNTCLTGSDHHLNNEGKVKRNYATYVELAAPWKLGSVDGSAKVGASLWDDDFVARGNSNFNIVNVMLTANKDVHGIPFFGSVIFNPQSEQTFFVVGMSF